MRYVYLLQSVACPEQHYVGMTDDLNRRLAAHNSGSSPHTSKYRPWRLIVAIRFDDDSAAAAFERYLKSGSGRAFARKHFWQGPLRRPAIRNIQKDNRCSRATATSPSGSWMCSSREAFDTPEFCAILILGGG